MARRPIRIALIPDESPATQIVDQIERLVALGAAGPGDELPPSAVLASELGIARGTVQKAYSLLIERKIAEARVGNGTFIASHADTRPEFLRRVFDMAISLGQNLYLTRDEIASAFEAEITRHFPHGSDEFIAKERRVSKE